MRVPPVKTWQWAVIAVMALVGIILLSGCDGGRKCLESHTEMRWMMVPQYNAATKMTDMHMQWYPVTVCDEYAPERR